MEMQTELVEMQVHSHRVVGGDSSAGWDVLDLDVLTTERDVETLDLPVNIIAHLFSRPLVGLSEARFFPHFVFQLRIGEVGGRDLCTDVTSHSENHQPQDRSQPNGSKLCVAPHQVQHRAWSRSAENGPGVG